MIEIDRLLRFLLYHQEMLVNVNFNWQRSFSRKRLIIKAAALKKIEYSPLGKELKKQTSIAEKQYQALTKLFKFDKKEEEPVTTKK